MPLTPRTDIKAQFRAQASLNSAQDAEHVIGEAQLDAALTDALAEYSRVQPVRGLSGTISAVTGTLYLALPVDWLINNNENKDILRAIEAGRDPNAPKKTYSSLQARDNRILNRYGYGAQSYGTFSPFRATLTPPLEAPVYPYGEPPVHKELIAGVFRPVFTMRAAAPSGKEWTVRYNGLHRIIDEVTSPAAPAVFTFPDEHLGVLFRLIVGCGIRAKGFDLIDAGSSPLAPDVNMIKQGNDMIERGNVQIDRALARVTPAGRYR